MTALKISLRGKEGGGGKEGDMGIPKPIRFNNKGLNEWNILHCYRGSIAHGTYRPNNEPNSIDDKDTMAVCIPPLDRYFGLKEYGSRGTSEIKQDEWDIVIYELRKFIRLLKKGNPNVLSVLWIEKEYFISKTDTGQMLIDNKELFVSKDVYFSFIGYAKAQLHRMTHMRFEGYMGEKRKRLVEKYGYDTKNASHLMRLLRMGIEFLTTGELQVLRKHDATELLEIKAGKWSMEQIQSEAKRLFALAEESFVRSDLPRKVDDNKINDFCVELLKKHFKER